MKFLHISDLHIGRRFNDVNLIDDQRMVIEQIAGIAERESCGAVLIAGDVYDKANPTAEAMSLFNDFLMQLSGLKIPVFIISGNHDSPQRLEYLSGLAELSGIHICGRFSGNLEIHRISDEYGDIDVCLLPFIRPADVRKYFPDAQIQNYDDAVRTVIEDAELDASVRKVIVCHQFVTGAQICDSEVFAVGGLDNISAENFREFDYAAMGHIHGAQYVQRPEVRYCGSPMKYSFSEANHHKSVTIFTLREKGDVEIEKIPLEAVHEVREVKGTLAELMEKPYSEDYVRVTVSDEIVPPDARISLLTVFPNMMKFAVENSKTGSPEEIDEGADITSKTPVELFEDFFRLMNNDVPPTEEQSELIKSIIERLGEENA